MYVGQVCLRVLVSARFFTASSGVESCTVQKTLASLGGFFVCACAQACVRACVCVCVYLNPSGQVYNRIGMRLRPFVNDRPTKSHSTSFAFLHLLPPSFPPIPLSPSFLLCLPVCLRRNPSIMTGQEKPGCFSFSHSTPTSPHFQSPSFVFLLASFLSLVSALAPVLSSWYGKPNKRRALKAEIFFIGCPLPNLLTHPPYI